MFKVSVNGSDWVEGKVAYEVHFFIIIVVIILVIVLIIINIVVIILINVVIIPFILKIGNYNALMADCPAYQKCESILIIIILLIISITIISIRSSRIIIVIISALTHSVSLL